MTVDDYIEWRNSLYLQAEGRGVDIGWRCWTELGVANRHITRILDNVLQLRMVEDEIVRCLERVQKQFGLTYEKPPTDGQFRKASINVIKETS